MAQLTTTTFHTTPAATRSATMRGARVPAENRIVQALGRRVQAQIAATQQTSNSYQAATGGAVRSPGGEPLTPLRGIQATAATPVGAPVGYGSGIALGNNLAPQRETPPPPLRPVQFGERGPLVTDARFDGDKWINLDSKTLFVWNRQAGEWLPIATSVDERTIGIEFPAAGNVYPIKAVAEARYLLISLSIRNRQPTGGSATAATATVMVNESVATMGTTVVEPDDFVGLRVDTVGTGILSASIVAGLA